ncbi:2-phosphosulfolactate phosphatase family protein [Prochlorococcus sp. MIT 1223]|uniref:2-phosphosulfolactate phosphatase family protein n=1 Tax=Prochlorococcus sp. MIT 1223 TaxID=3096217 RepID=UPI002A758102|nr:2-phosphosulfolactate phosphatase family protein [Prochlorococcus sp. MIT 1223]
MKLSYFHGAEDVPKDFRSDTAVVIDVLRATTTIAWAFTNGADSVQTFIDLKELQQESLKWPVEQRLLIGERGGKTLKGFDLGNSPLGVTPEIVKGKRIFMSTTNGTKALNRVRDFNNVYTLSLPNRSAVAERILLDKTDDICILGSGWEGSYSLEDSLAAGALASFLLESGSESIVANDELNAALALWHFWKDDLQGCLRVASHGQRLAGIGNHDDDFACCSELDNLVVVPYQSEPGVLCAY